MRFTRRSWLALLPLATAFVVQSAPAQELQAGKPIRLIVALSAGGGTDVQARLVAQKMSASMGMNVLVENKTGGNFIPAGREVLTAPPDGTPYFISTSPDHADAAFGLSVDITNSRRSPRRRRAADLVAQRPVKTLGELPIGSRRS